MDEKMYMSEEIGEIAAALAAFQGQVKQPTLKKVVKVATPKGSYNFKYADLSECMNSAKKPLADNGLAVTQLVVNGALTTLLLHKSGQWIRSQVMLAQQANIQAYGSQLTYLKRYSYCAILGLVADDDDDANAACGNHVQYQSNAQSANKAEGLSPQPSALSLKEPYEGMSAVDVFNAYALPAINQAQTKEDLARIWTDYPMLQQGCTHFTAALTARRKQLGIKNNNEQ